MMAGSMLVTGSLSEMADKKVNDCYGYFPVFRCLMGHPSFPGIWENCLRFRLLMWIYHQARWPDNTVRTPRGQTVSKGEFVTSIASLAEKVGWEHGPGRKWYTPSESSIKRALEYFEKANLITTQTDNRGTHIRVENFEKCPVHAKEFSESAPETADPSIPQPEAKREETDGVNSLNDNEIESCSASNRGANEGEMGREPETSKTEPITKTKTNKDSSPKGESSGSRRAKARPPRRNKSSSSKQHLRNGKEKFQAGLTIMATAGGYPEEVKEIVKKLRPMAISVYKAKRKPFPKPWYSDNCREIEEWVAEGKTLEEIDELLNAALEDDWWGPKLQSISMLRKFETRPTEDRQKQTARRLGKKGNLCPDCGKANFYCKCGTK